MLDTQINMYSVDTGHFYSNSEKYLHEMNCKYRRERNYISNKLDGIKKDFNTIGCSDDTYELIKKDIEYILSDIEKTSITDMDQFNQLRNQLNYWNRLIAHKRKKANESKEKLLKILATKVYEKENTAKYNEENEIKKDIPLRYLRQEELKDTNVISVFESSLTRTIGIKKDELTDALIVVQVYYFDVFKDLSFYGFMYKGEKYRYFTSSAGQIRKKKAVFIKESVWNQVEKTVMCGLTIDKINSKGGNNVNKHLAYMALANSATDQWVDFDIDRCIVIDDFETNVPGTFDFIDETNYSIERKTGLVPIPHTDGAGMILPCLMDKNTMFRAPWIKGLLGVFDRFRC